MRGGQRQLPLRRWQPRLVAGDVDGEHIVVDGSVFRGLVVPLQVCVTMSDRLQNVQIALSSREHIAFPVD